MCIQDRNIAQCVGEPDQRAVLGHLHGCQTGAGKPESNVAVALCALRSKMLSCAPTFQYSFVPSGEAKTGWEGLGSRRFVPA